MELNRLDYCIMKLLKKNNCISFFESMTLQEIMNTTHTSRPTTYRKMMNLKKLGYVEAALAEQKERMNKRKSLSLLDDLDMEEEPVELVQRPINKRRQLSLDLLHELD